MADEPLSTADDILARVGALLAELNALPGIRAHVDITVTIRPDDPAPHATP